jgi:Xaa-Pro aminopeptidase
LEALGIAEGKIGIDADYLPLASYQHLMRRLPKLRLVDTTGDLAAIRAIKTPAQIDILEKAAMGTHRAALDAMQASRIGDTELQMIGRIGDGIVRNGAERPFFLYLLSGDRTTVSHGLPSDRKLRESEIVRFDVGGIYGAFCSDFARTYSSGNPTALQRRTYAALREIEEMAIAAVKPGVPAEAIYNLCRDEYPKRGLTFRMGLVGHSLGVELHEKPVMRPGETIALAPGMVLNVEVSVTDEDNTYYHLEDLVVVTETGNRLLTLGLPPKEIPFVGDVVTTDR